MSRGHAGSRHADHAYGDAMRGAAGKPVLLPSLPGPENIVIDRELAAELTQAYLDMGPDDRKSRAIGVLRYLMYKLEPGFENSRFPPRELREQVLMRSSGPPVSITLEDAEWRSVYRAVGNAGRRGAFMSAERADQISRRLFSAGIDELDVDLICSRCGAIAAAQDARVVEGRWVGEVCCLGRERMVPASSFPEDARNFSAGR